MAQGTLNIINQGFPSFRADLNDQLEALATLSSGPTAPTTTYPFQLWVDTSQSPPVLKQRNEANNAFVDLGSAAGLLGSMAVQNANNVNITGGSVSVPNLTATNDADIHGLTIGLGAGDISTNTAIGRSALQDNTTGASNTAIGRTALQANTMGGNNTSIGRLALFSNTTGASNTAIGRSALQDNTTGGDNTAIGTFALQDNTTGGNNIGVGLIAGRSGSPFAVTTQNNRIVMGNNDHTDAYIRIAWTVTSDARDKAETKPIPHGLDFVNQLKPTEYQFKAGGRDGDPDGRRRYGFLAQDVLQVEGSDPVIVDAEDDENLKLHESYLVPVLVNAIKELTARIEELEQKS